MSQPNDGNAFCVFFSFRCISTECAGHALTLFVTGVLNCSVAFNGASVRENPDEEKSCQVNVARFAARACGASPAIYVSHAICDRSEHDAPHERSPSSRTAASCRP